MAADGGGSDRGRAIIVSMSMTEIGKEGRDGRKRFSNRKAERTESRQGEAEDGVGNERG